MSNIEELLAQGIRLPWAEQEKHFTVVLEDYNTVEAPKIEESLIAELYNRRGIARRTLGNYDGSVNDYQLALAITTDPNQRALARINLADVHRMGFKDFSQAHASLDEALTFIDNGTLIHAQAVDQRGLIFQAEGNYETALACYRRAISICEELLNLDLPKENDDLQRSLRSSSALEAMDRLVQAYQHQGEAAFDLYRKNKEVSPLRLAIESEEKVMELSTKSQQPNSMNTLYKARQRLGLISFESGEVQKALDDQFSALDYAGLIGSQKDIGISSLYVAECLFSLGRSQEAVPHLKRFQDSVVDGIIPRQDYFILKPKVKNTMDLIQRAGLSLFGFAEVAKRFGN